MTISDQSLCAIVNQLHSIDVMSTDDAKLTRKLTRIRELLEAENIYVHSPLGEPYDDTRIDCEATISGEGVDDLVIVDVVKPIIYNRSAGDNQILQRAVVIVESK